MAPLGDKVSMLTLYTHTKPGGKLMWSYAKSPDWQPTLCVAWCLICWFALAYKKYGHTWHRMSLLRPGVIKQHKPITLWYLQISISAVEYYVHLLSKFVISASKGSFVLLAFYCGKVLKFIVASLMWNTLLDFRQKHSLRTSCHTSEENEQPPESSRHNLEENGHSPETSVYILASSEENNCWLEIS